MSTERILTDDMIAEIKAFFPRYPTRQAVTLPALHVVNERLRYVPLQAVVEIAELLDVPLGTIKSDHHRAIKKLRECGPNDL